MEIMRGITILILILMFYILINNRRSNSIAHGWYPEEKIELMFIHYIRFMNLLDPLSSPTYEYIYIYIDMYV